MSKIKLVKSQLQKLIKNFYLITFVYIICLSFPHLSFGQTNITLWLIGEKAVKNAESESSFLKLVETLKSDTGGIDLLEVNKNNPKRTVLDVQLRVLHQESFLIFLNHFAKENKIIITIKILSWPDAFFQIKNVLLNKNKLDRPDLIQVGSSWLPDIITDIHKLSTRQNSVSV